MNKIYGQPVTQREAEQRKWWKEAVVYQIDVSDYRDIMKEFGTMEDFDVLLKGLHERGICMERFSGKARLAG